MDSLMLVLNKSSTQKSSDHLANPAGGRLADISSLELIQKLHRARFTGVLNLQFQAKKKKLWFKSGEIVKVQSNMLPELLGQMMIEKRWLNEADLEEILSRQKSSQENQPLGEFARELVGLKRDELEQLHLQQMVRSILQAMTWDDGEYEIAEDEISEDQIHLSLHDFFKLTDTLLRRVDEAMGPLLRIVQPWMPKSGTINLGEFPVYSILAGCRIASSNGILSIRKHNKLYEIVIKHGIPLTYYEGTFGQPRQTIVVRQASEEHEKFFVDHVFRLFSFLTGSAYFRSLGTESESKERPSHLQIQDPLEGTRVLKDSMGTKVGLEKWLQGRKYKFVRRLWKLAVRLLHI